MFNKFLSVLIICSVIFISSNYAVAQKRGSWTDLQNLFDQEIAAKTRAGKTFYGVLKSADDNGLRLRLAEKKSVGAGETFVSREEIEKIWRARLFINQRKTVKGALIGAAIGSAAMGGISVAQDSSDPLAAAGFVIGAIPGALVGGAVGFFSKKKHSKGALIFEK